MTIRISRNAAANCINFVGSSLPAYYNACLSGAVDADTGTVNVVNDVQTANNPNGEIKYEFYQIPHTQLADKDGNPFATAQEAADYITQEGNVLGVSDVGTSLNGVVVNFRLDQTSTSIIMDNGSAFGVNTIKAVPDTDGTIHIHAIGAGVPEDSSEPNDHKHFEGLEVGNVQINGVTVSGGLNDICNALNELFTVGPFESVVISDPFSTMVADVNGVAAGYTLEGSTAVDPSGDDIFTNSGSGNYAGLKSTATIDQAGEYFTFDIRGEGQIGFGLVHSDSSYAAGNYQGSSTYADPAQFAVGNSAHSGYQFSHWFHPTPNGSWTNYGASTGFIRGPGWSNWDQQQDWLDGNPVKIRVGIDENGFIAISSLQDDGTWTMHARTSYPVPEGSEFHLGIKATNASPRVYTAPNVHLLEPAAPVLNFRYIESPDGYYSFPLFATQEEADYYEEQVAGADNGSHTHQYDDDPTYTTWYMPSTSNQMNYGLTPVEDGVTTFMGNPINWTEITSLTNADPAPPAYTDSTVEVNELQSVNIQTQPQDTGYVTTFSGVPAGLLTNAGTIYGTAPEVTGDNVANPHDDYTVTVTRTNNYGSSTGTLTLRVLNLTAPVVSTGNWSGADISAGVLPAGGDANLDITLSEGERLVVPKSWVDAVLDPNNNLTSMSESYFLGVLSGSASDPYGLFDYDGVIRFNGSSTNSYHFVTLYDFDSGDGSTSSDLWSNNGASVYDYGIEYSDGKLHLIACNVNSLNTEPSIGDGGSFSKVITVGNVTGSLTITLSTEGASLNLSGAANLEKLTIPAAPANATSWTKAIDFDGSSERMQIVDNSYHRVAMKMSGLNNQVSGGSKVITSSDAYARPWATAIVFKSSTYNSNQHVWNVGEGTGDTDDNIYLRKDANRNLWFGMGRSGDLIECYIGSIANNIDGWHAVYIGHSGARFGSGNTASDLENAFDFRYTSGANSWAVGTNQSTQANWNSGTVGGRMNRSFDGYFTIGGRGANRSFRGKIASMVSTTLRRNVAMPTDAEIFEMITDPMDWLTNYKVGNPFRLPWQAGDAGWNFSINDGSSGYSTQVWLMGDGAMDSYSNMIRNQVTPSDQNYTKLNMISMVSNDIQNVTISGLS